MPAVTEEVYLTFSCRRLRRKMFAQVLENHAAVNYARTLTLLHLPNSSTEAMHLLLPLHC
jgi:hypothetical protein